MRTEFLDKKKEVEKKMRRFDFHFDGLICMYNVTKQIKQLEELILHNYNVERCNVKSALGI